MRVNRRYVQDRSSFVRSQGLVCLNNGKLSAPGAELSPNPTIWTDPSGRRGGTEEGDKRLEQRLGVARHFWPQPRALPKGVVPIESATSASATRQRYGPAGTALSLRHNPGETPPPSVHTAAARLSPVLRPLPSRSSPLINTSSFPSLPPHLPRQAHTDSQTHCIRAHAPLQRRLRSPSD